jgi:hypothetical protein
MTTWDAINGKLCYFLDDNPAGGAAAYQFALPLRIDAWNWAQRFFQNHTAREQEAEITIDESGRAAPLPPDLIDIAMIYDRTNERTYSLRRFSEGAYRSESDEYFAYWKWAGRLHFSRTVGKGEKLTVEYFAAWPKIEYAVNDGNVVIVRDEILVPEWAELALAHLTAATVLQPPAITAAMSNEYKIKIDSGTPLDNPREQQARAHLWWYNELIGLFSPQNRQAGV